MAANNVNFEIEIEEEDTDIEIELPESTAVEEEVASEDLEIELDTDYVADKIAHNNTTTKSSLLKDIPEMQLRTGLRAVAMGLGLTPQIVPFSEAEQEANRAAAPVTIPMAIITGSFLSGGILPAIATTTFMGASKGLSKLPRISETPAAEAYLESAPDTPVTPAIGFGGIPSQGQDFDLRMSPKQVMDITQKGVELLLAAKAGSVVAKAYAAYSMEYMPEKMVETISEQIMKNEPKFMQVLADRGLTAKTGESFRITKELANKWAKQYYLDIMRKGSSFPQGFEKFAKIAEDKGFVEAGKKLISNTLLNQRGQLLLGGTIPQDLITRFNLSPTQLQQIARGNFAGLGSSVIKAFTNRGIIKTATQKSTVENSNAEYIGSVGQGDQEQVIIKDPITNIKTQVPANNLTPNSVNKAMSAERAKIKATNDKKIAETKQVLLDTQPIDLSFVEGGAGQPNIPPAEVPKAKQILQRERAITLRPGRLWRGMDGGRRNGPWQDTFMYGADNAENVKITNVERRIGGMRDAMEELKVSRWKLDLHGFTDKYGAKFTRDQVISMYAGSKNPEKLASIIYGNKIEFDDVVKAITAMPAEDKLLGDAIIAEYKQNYERENDAVVKFFDGNKGLGNIKDNYTPISRQGSMRPKDLEQLSRELMRHKEFTDKMAKKDFSKLRRKDIPKKLQEPIRLGETALWFDQVYEREHFVAYGNYVKNMDKIINDPRIEASIQETLGQPGLESLKRYVTRLGNPNFYHGYVGATKYIAMARRNAALAYLPFRLATVTKQFPSMVAALKDVNPLEMAQGMFQVNKDPIKQTTIKEIHKLSPQMKQRSINRSLQELKNVSPSKFGKIRDKVGNTGMIGIIKMDQMVTHGIWWAIYQKQLRLNPNLSEQEAANVTTRRVLETQPASSPKDLADLYATNEVLNSMLQFTNQLNNYWNIATSDIPNDWRTGNKSGAIAGATGLALSTGLIWMISNRKFPKNYKEFKQLASESAFSMIPILGRSLEKSRKGFGAGVSIPALGGYEDIVWSVANFTKGKFKKGAKDVFEGVSAIVGAPISGPTGTIKFVEGVGIVDGEGNTFDLGLDMDVDGEVDIDFEIDI